jgi:hypothetical protein
VLCQLCFWQVLWFLCSNNEVLVLLIRRYTTFCAEEELPITCPGCYCWPRMRPRRWDKWRMMPPGKQKAWWSIGRSSVEVLFFPSVSSHNNSVLFSNLRAFSFCSEKNLLTKAKLLNLNSEILCFGFYGSGVENRCRADSLEWSLLFTRRALCGLAAGRWWGCALIHVLSSVLAVSSVVLARNKVVATVAQQPVRHLSPRSCRVLPSVFFYFA